MTMHITLAVRLVVKPRQVQNGHVGLATDASIYVKRFYRMDKIFTKSALARGKFSLCEIPIFTRDAHIHCENGHPDAYI